MTETLNYLIKAEIFSAYFNKKANAEAQRLYQEAINADASKTFSRPCADLAYAILQAYLYNWHVGDPKNAIAEMNNWAQEAVRREPNDPYNDWIQADVFLYSKDFGKAATNYTKLGVPKNTLPLPAEEWAFSVDYADLLLLSGDAKQAIAIVDDVLQHCPKPEKWFYWVQSWAYYADGGYQKSLDALKHFHIPRNAIRKNKIASLVGLNRIPDAQNEARTFLDEEKEQGITYAVAGQQVLPGLLPIEDRIPFQDQALKQRWNDHIKQAFTGVLQP